MATHSSILAWRIPWTEEPGYSPCGHKELVTTERLTHKWSSNCSSLIPFLFWCRWEGEWGRRWCTESYNEGLDKTQLSNSCLIACDLGIFTAFFFHFCHDIHHTLSFFSPPAWHLYYNLRLFFLERSLFHSKVEGKHEGFPNPPCSHICTFSLSSTSPM